MSTENSKDTLFMCPWIGYTHALISAAIYIYLLLVKFILFNEDY